MKTGIITLVGNNYGNRLQNYAVQELLKMYGDDVYTVIQEKKVSASKDKGKLKKLNPAHIKDAVDSRLLNIYHLSNRRMNTVTRFLFFIRHREDIKSAISKRNIAFKKFDEKYIQFEVEMLHLSGDDEENWVKSYDAWVCGSDQIWNPNYPTATRNAFLQFTDKERRISLSASIGLSDINVMPEEYKEWMKGINHLSVREEAAAEIVKELTGKEAKVFLDPTMLLSKKYWDKMADSAECDLPYSFALSYFLGVREKEYEDYILSFSKENNLEVVELLNGEYPKYLEFGPDQMLDSIRKSQMVFVDSFHGAVFSIIFHKQFVVFERKETGLSMNSRLQTLLKTFGMENRIFTGDNVKELLEPIDYSKADEIILREQKKVKEFLDNAMSDISNLEKPIEKKKLNIKLTKKEHCFGCGACSNTCPKKCIVMNSDEEGFLYPEINKELCVNCGKCISVCPYYNRVGNDIKKVYAAINTDDDIRRKSSSGGTFYELSKSVIQDGGCVFGCAWDDNMTAKHIKVESLDMLYRLQGSKYVQSCLDNVYYETKEELMSGRKVIFSGTPCQVSGLKNYLGKDYENLLLVDVLCHGVPSPKVLDEYESAVEKKYGSRIVHMNVRDKKKSWHRLHTDIRFENGKKLYTFCAYDTYMSMFLTDMSQRPSCFECKFTSKNRQGDITLGDFWGIGIHANEMDDDKGTSMVAVNTEKGSIFWNKIKDNFNLKEMSFEIAEAGNKVLSQPPKKNLHRDEFYKDFIKSGYVEATEKWVDIPSKPEQLYYDIMRKGLDFYRWLFGKKY